MVAKLSYYIARRIYKSEQKNSIEVLRFGLDVILNLILTLMIAFSVSFALGTLNDSVVVFLSFALLRSTSGGIHLHKSEHCIAVSSLIIIAIPWIPHNGEYMYVLDIISVLLILMFAPSRMDKQLRISEKRYKLLKVLSLMIVLSNALWFHNPLVSLTFLVQSVTLIHYPLKKEVSQ